MKTYIDGLEQAIRIAEDIRIIADNSSATVRAIDLMIRSLRDHIEIENRKEAAKRIQQGSFF